MPLKYYLYVIYAAVFLFKAQATGALGLQASTSVRRSIQETIDRLKRSSTCHADMGHRYSRLLRLLWRKAPSGANGASDPELSASNSERQFNDAAATAEPEQMFPQGFNPLNAFSWRDLDSVGQFVVGDDPNPSSYGGDVYGEDIRQSFSAFDVYSTEGINNFTDYLGGSGDFTF